MTDDRRTAVTEAALSVLAREGSRGLTHRAVDRELGIPDGSTGNYFPTRASLLLACADRLAERNVADALALAPEGGAPSDQLTVAATITAFLLSRLEDEASARQLARLELSIEATRSDELAARFAELRTRFIDGVAALLAATGVSETQNAARGIVAAYDGLLFDQLLYPQTAPDRDVLAEQVTAIVLALLHQK